MWQRLLLSSALVFGLLLGVAATVFGYSNRTSVDVGWSVFHLYGVPLWTVAVVPVAIVLVCGTVYHWYRSLYHFTEHMRHRRRVHELEAELVELRGQLDHLLEMSPQATPAKQATLEPDVVPATVPAPADPAGSNGSDKLRGKTSARRRVSLTPAASATEEDGTLVNGSTDTTPQTEPVQET
ncbi:MAG: hypothetical protein E6J53_07075 [Chloroflexi bacterium]|nr:MAG: hypothetical protein E6J53_07075 [Chloroflexota bacterium]